MQGFPDFAAKTYIVANRKIRTNDKVLTNGERQARVKIATLRQFKRLLTTNVYIEIGRHLEIKAVS